MIDFTRENGKSPASLLISPDLEGSSSLILACKLHEEQAGMRERERESFPTRSGASSSCDSDDRRWRFRLLRT